MKKILLTLAALFVVTASARADEAYDFSLKEISSTNKITLSDYRGKVVLLNFWATWCPPCRAEIPDMIKLQKKYSNDLVIIGVSLDRDGEDKVRDFMEAYKINYPVVMGNYTLTTKYGGIRAIPTTFLIDQDGDVGQKIVGARNYNGFEDLILPYIED